MGNLNIGFIHPGLTALSKIIFKLFVHENYFPHLYQVVASRVKSSSCLTALSYTAHKLRVQREECHIQLPSLGRLLGGVT